MRAGLHSLKALLRGLRSSGGTLEQRSARGGLWAFASYGGVRLLAVVRSVALARLLLPADFGLVNMAQVAVGFVAIWTEIGVAPALIHSQENDAAAWDTAWILSAGRGLLLCAITFACAGPIAAFFREPGLVPIVRALAFTFIGYGLCSVGLVVLRKEIEFRRLAFVELGSEILSLAAGVVAAVVLRSAWALVLAALAKVFLVLLGSYLAHPYRPRLRWNAPAARRLAGYGKYILGAGIAHYLLTQGDNALVGRMLGSAQLGLYGVGYNLANMPSTSISSVIGQVAFPTYAKLQHDRLALVRAYLRVLKLTAVLAVPLLTGIMSLAPELVRVLFGEKWLPMALPLLVLCIGGLERAITSPAAPLFNAMGRPRTVFSLLVAKLLLFGGAVWPLTRLYGILGTSAAGAATSVILLIYTFPLTARLLGCKTTAILRAVAGPAGAGAAMAVCLVLLKLTAWFRSDALSLLLLVAIGAVVFAAALYALDRDAIEEVRRLVRSQLGTPTATTLQASDAPPVQSSGDRLP